MGVTGRMPLRRLRASLPCAAVALAVAAVAALAGACGDSGDGFEGTWLRTDDHAFVLTITKHSGEGYELRFENTSIGESQTVGAVARPNGTLQAAFEIPQESTGALAPGVPDIVPISLSIEDGVLVVRMDGAGGSPDTLLWNYERSEQ
jgi:hypothetical protein